ncbi:MAG: hypothetical protein WDM89_07525 [Rhizomicrobium sp.]
MGGGNVKVDSGATVDVSGGGDLYAYEFVAGVGGSHDVLDRFNDDEFTSSNGYQYPDGRQVYAIVPSLGNTQAALYDPVYSAEYSDLYSVAAAGKQVYLNNVPGLAAGWYTLLPAKYATLPGGLRVVENTDAQNVAPGSYTKLKDGSFIVTGYYGTAGTGDYDSIPVSFTVQMQATFDKYSNIALTSANQKFAADAAHDGNDAPPLPEDAGRLVLAPSDTLEVDASINAEAGKGGRGAEVDISGAAFEIASEQDAAAPDGTIVLTADELTNLNATSLLIGGTRTDNADGTTNLNVTATSILVDNDAAHPLSAPEVVLAVEGSGANITLADGATIIATGDASNARSGNYIVDGSQDNAVVRVASGGQRLVTRTNIDGATNGDISVGEADLEGGSILLDSSGDLTASPNAILKTDDLALGAGQVTFTDDGTGLSGLVITSELQALISQAKELTISTPGTIDFSSGTYNFNDLTLDTPGLELKDGNAVTIDAGKLTLSNSSSDLGACGGDSSPACGSGALTLNASEIDFASGTVHTYGFGDSTTLAVTTGIFAAGDATFDVGGAALNIQSPFIGDNVAQAAPGDTATAASLSLVSTGAVTITNPTGAAAGNIPGLPGATISIDGGSVDIESTTIRATAGTLDIQSATTLTVGAGAVLSTPGYERNFGDAADPFVVYAPGGLVHLTALDGDIDLEQGSLVSVGGGTGTAGTVEFSASQGNVIFDGTLDAHAPQGGGSFVLDQNGPFDISNFSQMFGDQFDSTIAVRTATGDLTLDAGAELKAANVMLTADGGTVDISGTIDVSGVSGGDASLYGLGGVTLHDGSVIDARAEGYGSGDTRQAHGGDVEIGTDGDGIITVDSGAIIDVSAVHTGDRLVPVVHNGKTYYIYVAGDVGGTVDFRAPVITDPNGSEDVNVFYNGQIEGASDIIVQGFEKFDLQQIASDPNFVGVTINDQGQAVLDLGATGTGDQVNWLSGEGAGTLVDFIHNFDISSADSHLGNLTSSGVFNERPGMELDYSGDIVLSTNWNLGAGTVDINAAVAAGDMVQMSDGKYYVVAGKEQDIWSKYTSLLYRTDTDGDGQGNVDGEAGMLTIRAGGNLEIDGSISDGFFNFHDQTDPDYLNEALGGGNKIYNPYLTTGCLGNGCGDVGAWEMMSGDDLPTSYVFVKIPDKNDLSAQLFNPAPYTAEANAADAASFGDPFGGAELFPLYNKADGTTQVVNSFSYQFVGGADVASVDPMRTRPGATGEVIVEGDHSYTFEGNKMDSTSAFGDQLFLTVGNQLVSADDWYDAFLGANPGLNADSFTYINFGSAPSDFDTFLLGQIPTFFQDNPNQYQYITQGKNVEGITTSLQEAAKFLADVVAGNFAQFKDDWKAPKTKVVTKPTTVDYRTLVRTGTGDISMAAATDIDLTNGNQSEDGLQVGGTAVYTAGHMVDPAAFTFVDSLTGLTATVDPSEFDQEQDLIDNQPVGFGYKYGAGDPGINGVGLTDVLIADPAFAAGGGNVTLTAGHDVLGHRDVWQTARLTADYDKLNLFGYTWIGTADQPWRVGQIGNSSVVRIDPQLFQEGVGTLGGGDITINAGHDVSDLSIVSDTSLTTGAVQPGGIAESSLALVSFGGGNVSINAGGDLLGGRVDIASGTGSINVGGNIETAGEINNGQGMQENELRLRLSDAFVTLEARGDIDMQGIAALGVGRPERRGCQQSRLPWLLLSFRRCLPRVRWQPHHRKYRQRRAYRERCRHR